MSKKKQKAEADLGRDDGAVVENDAMPAEHDAETRIAELEARAADAEARALRAMADFQNFQRRSANNEIEAKRQGITAVVMGLLPVLDNFGLALQQRDAGASPEQIVGGVEMVRAELFRALEMQGVTRIDAEPGAELDPARHEAVSQMPMPGVKPGRIGQVFQIGYALGDRVLRPAKVVVAIEPPEADSDAGGSGMDTPGSGAHEPGVKDDAG